MSRLLSNQRISPYCLSIWNLKEEDLKVSPHLEYQVLESRDVTEMSTKLSTRSNRYSSLKSLYTRDYTRKESSCSRSSCGWFIQGTCRGCRAWKSACGSAVPWWSSVGSWSQGNHISYDQGTLLRACNVMLVQIFQLPFNWQNNCPSEHNLRKNVIIIHSLHNGCGSVNFNDDIYWKQGIIVRF